MDLIDTSDASPAERALAVLQLMESGTHTQQDVEAMAGRLLADIEENGAHLPRIEGIYRNALIRSLLVSGSDSPKVAQALSLALVEPLTERLDREAPKNQPIFEALRQGRPLEALAHYRARTDEPQPLLSQGDRLRDGRPRGPTENVRAYTPQFEHKGTVFKVGTGETWQGVERIAPADFKAISEELAREFPAAADWRQPDYPHLYRIPLTRVDPDGSSQTIYLGGPEFIIDGRDEKLHGWSIAIDKNGIIHLTGGMHNSPNESYYIPGTWERMGISRDNDSPDFPRAMVWVSTRPYDLESLVFVGHRDNPLCPPVPDGLNYMNYVQDREGELYIYSRIGVSGIQSWGLYRFNTAEQRWSAIGGPAIDILRDAQAAHPDWERYLERSFGHVQVPQEAGPAALAWAWQAHFYNYCRDPRSVQFDLENRMHVWVRLFAIDGKGHHVYRRLYAFSDDGGESFRRIDGSLVELPLTLNPAPHHLADASAEQAELWWQLWASLYHPAGYHAE